MFSAGPIKVYDIIKDNNQLFITVYKKENSSGKTFFAYILINDI